MREQRFRRLLTSKEIVLCSLIHEINKDYRAYVTQETKLPLDIEIVDVQYDKRGWFIFTIYHPTFDIVLDEQEIPVHEMRFGKEPRP